MTSTRANGDRDINADRDNDGDCDSDDDDCDSNGDRKVSGDGEDVAVAHREDDGDVRSCTDVFNTVKGVAGTCREVLLSCINLSSIALTAFKTSCIPLMAMIKNM